MFKKINENNYCNFTMDKNKKRSTKNVRQQSKTIQFKLNQFILKQNIEKQQQLWSINYTNKANNDWVKKLKQTKQCMTYINKFIYLFIYTQEQNKTENLIHYLVTKTKQTEQNIAIYKYLEEI